MARINALASRDALAAEAAAQIVAALQAGIEARGSACAALSGGSAEAIYVHLARAELDWRNVTFALVDERFVPPMMDASNEGMVRRALARASLQGARFASMFWPIGDLEDAARHADEIYAPLTIDIALMGMGADGHTASWFPGADGLSAALDPNTPRSVVAIHAPNAPGAPERLTLTLSALARAKRVLLAISGDEKRAVLERALSKGDAPVAALFKPPLNTEVLWAP